MTAPDSAPAVVTSPNFIRILSTSKGDPAAPATSSSASSMVSAQYGGTVTNGRVTLTFPAGALNEDTQITIDMLDDGTLGVELSPHGIQFNKPVTMSMDLRGTTGEGMGNDAQTYYFNEDTGLYELQDKLPGGSDTCNAELHHFSKYKGGIAP